MKFFTCRINIRKITLYLFLFALAAAGMSAMPDAAAAGLTYGGRSGQIKQPLDILGDVGGEYVSDSDEYSGELAVPANISLEKLVISDAVTYPLESARVSSLFGYRKNPVTGKYSFHSGLDLAAAKGSEIHAMYSGTVVRADYDSGYGNFVTVDHGSFQTLYAHCSELLCVQGDEVAAGDVIALVGSTGNSTGPHLHVEFRRDGKRFDPEWILGGVYS